MWRRFLSAKQNYHWRHQQRQLSRQLPRLVQLMVTSLSAGNTLESALNQAGLQVGDPFATLIARTLAQMRAGMPLNQALATWRGGQRLEELDLLITTLTMASHSGSRLRDSLKRVERLAVGKFELAQKVAAITAQGRLQGWIMAGLPLLILFTVRLVDADYLTPLLHTKLGHLILIASILLNLVGLLWIRKLTQLSL